MAVVEQNPQGRRIASDSVNFAEIPWYRDVRVIRAIAQIVFLIGVLFGGTVVINNMLNNLQSSNIPLNFGIYRAPFAVALPEGPSATATWEWLQDTQTIQVGVTVLYVVIAATLVYGLWAHRDGLMVFLNGTLGFGKFIAGQIRRARQPENAVQEPYRIVRSDGERLPPKTQDGNYVMAALLLFLLVVLAFFVASFPPDRMPQELNRYLVGGSMTRAFITGIANTLRVVVFSLIACTILGILVGIGLLSRNFVVRTTAKVFVEIFRNTPLPVQLLFIYRMLTLILPRPQDSIYTSSSLAFWPTDFELYAINTRGLYLASPQSTASTWLFLLIMVVALVICAVIRRRRLANQEATGEPAHVFRYTISVWIGALALGWIVTGALGDGAFTASYPELAGRQIAGGTHLTTAFFALFIGLTLYTCAFIAEIVRAGIQAVPYGQIEAAQSQGFSGAQVLQLVILPQALRLIIPPLGNQYVNLGKNSSLGIIVTYVDVYRVAQLANNESGQAVPFFVGLMVIYLLLSLILSTLTNFVNRSTQLRTR